MTTTTNTNASTNNHTALTAIASTTNGNGNSDNSNSDSNSNRNISDPRKCNTADNDVNALYTKPYSSSTDEYVIIGSAFMPIGAYNYLAATTGRDTAPSASR